MFWFKPKAPFRLKRGLYLESTGALLPWNASIGTLRRTARSENTGADRITLRWTDETVFDGIAVDVHWQNILPETFFLTLKDSFNKPAIEGYNAYLPKLIARFGKPHRERVDDGRPRSGMELWSRERQPLCVG